MALSTTLGSNLDFSSGNCLHINPVFSHSRPISGRTIQFRRSFGESELKCLKVDSAITCEPCNGRGWLVCEFCQGQKTNVKGENNRIYRRCPSCRAVGYMLCSNCKVFKCVTFPDYSDG